MSFSRAPLKRFNEHIGCAPAPGSYEVKPGEPKGPASFLKSERFKSLKAGTDSVMLPPPSPSRNVSISPVRRTMSVDGLPEMSSVKKERSGINMEIKQQRTLEKEIRSLVQQRGEQDRRLLALEDELKKAEAKLLVAVRERTGLSAGVTTLERQLAELKKANEFLKNKASADTSKKKINSLTLELMDARNNVDLKNKEISALQMNTDGQIKVLETDLRAAKAAVAELKDKCTDFDNLQQDADNVLQNETDELNVIIHELREEVKALQAYLDIANDEIQDLRIQLCEKIQMESLEEARQEKVTQLEAELNQLSTGLHVSQEVLRQKEEESAKHQRELQASQDALQDTEKRLMDRTLALKSSEKALSELQGHMKQNSSDLLDSRSTVHQQEAELTRLREVLRRTEKELDERVAHLEQRCLFFEEDRSKTQEEGFRRVEDLKTELNSLKEVKREEKKKWIQLQQENADLTEELEKEKAYVDLLSEMLERERKESEEQVGQLKEEIEEVLGELTAMEDKDQRSQELVEKSQDALQGLQQEFGELQRQLSEARTCLDSQIEELASANESHFAAMRNLQEENTNLSSRIGDVTTELENTKRALRETEERGRALEALESVTQQMKEEMDGALRQREEVIQRLREDLEEQRQAQEKAREKSARSETEHWRAKYEELFSKVKPFQEQLNGFAAERDALLNKNGANQEELNKLADAYAQLLGHHNQKQKIKHVVKLKDENITLKQEVTKLRSQVSRHKMDLEQLSLKLRGATRRRFDPSKAFQHDSKENRQPETPSALRVGNY